MRSLDFRGAKDWLAPKSDQEIAQILGALAQVSHSRAVEILEEFPLERRKAIAALQGSTGEQWLLDHAYPERSVGRLMERAPAVFPPSARVGEVIEQLREAVKQTLITYVFVVDERQRLVGVVAFRELVFAAREQCLDEIMLRQPYSLKPRTPLLEAMREVVTRHYPVYPVCDEQGRLLGLVRGQSLFEQQAFEISAQAGAMVGVEQEERTGTPWQRSLWFRHPWLQLNLFTAFVAAAVVGVFQDTLAAIVLLAVFMPVLSGQSSNSGVQALAVTLRGLTLGEIQPGDGWKLIAKESWLGFLNGLLTGLVAGAGMAVLAWIQRSPFVVELSVITVLAMVGSCVLAGMAGAGVPLLLKRLGADPATASSIFLTTATDVVSMGLFLGLAAWWLM